MSTTKALLLKFKASKVIPRQQPEGIIPINFGSGGQCDKRPKCGKKVVSIDFGNGICGGGHCNPRPSHCKP